MAQNDIVNFLKNKKGKKFTTKQMSNELKLPINNIQNSCNKAWRNDLIEREITKDSKTFLYFIKKKQLQKINNGKQ